MDREVKCNYQYNLKQKVIISKDFPQYKYVEGIGICPFSDRIFVATGLSKSVVVLSPAGDYLYSIRDDSRTLFTPWGVCFLGNIICVSEFTNHSIVFMTHDGDIVSRVGENYPFIPGVFLTNPTRPTSYLDTDVFVCDSGNRRVLHLFPSFPFCKEIGARKLSTTEDVRIFNDHIYVLDWRYLCVAIFNMEGELMDRIVTRGGSRLTGVTNPFCFTIDHVGNNLFSDSGSGCIVISSPSGQLLHMLGKRGMEEGELESPMGIGVNSHHQVVVVSRREKHGIQIFKDLY